MLNVNKALGISDHFSTYRNVESILIKGTSIDHPKISVCIPTFKRAETLKETINSCLCQIGYDDYVIIVSDNNPERGDETENYLTTIDSAKLLYYKNEQNIGMYGNINRLFELSKSEYTVCIHDDDLLMPHFLFTVNEVLKRNNCIDVLYPQFVIWRPEMETQPTEKITSNIYIYKNKPIDYVFTNPHPPTGFVINTKKMKELGGFDLDTYPSNDYYFCVKACSHLSVYTLHHPLYIYRWEVNASQRLETILSFIKVDIPLKRYLIDKYFLLKPFWKPILLLYSKSKKDVISKNYPGYDMSQVPLLVKESGFLMRLITKIFHSTFIRINQIRHLVSAKNIIIHYK